MGVLGTDVAPGRRLEGRSWSSIPADGNEKSGGGCVADRCEGPSMLHQYDIIKHSVAEGYTYQQEPHLVQTHVEVFASLRLVHDPAKACLFHHDQSGLKCHPWHFHLQELI